MEQRSLKIGRPSKGDRTRKQLRLWTPLAAAAEQCAGELGTDFNAYCALVVAEDLRRRGFNVDDGDQEHDADQEHLMTA
ncbi:MAG TPA: hypothetical protein VGL02_33025 [Streptomyces sp.]